MRIKPVTLARSLCSLNASFASLKSPLGPLMLSDNVHARSFASLIHWLVRLLLSSPLVFFIAQLCRASLCSLTGFLPVSLSLLLLLSPIELHILTRITPGILHKNHHKYNHNHIRFKNKCLKLRKSSFTFL